MIVWTYSMQDTSVTMMDDMYTPIYRETYIYINKIIIIFKNSVHFKLEIYNSECVGKCRFSC